MDIRELWNRYQAGERDFRGVDLHGETNLFDMTGVDFSEANLSNITLDKLKFDNVNFNGANLQRANISEVFFLNSNLSNSDLREAKIHDLGFNGVDLSNIRLVKAWLIHTSIDRCNFSNADLTEAVIADVNFVECNLTKSQWINVSSSPVNFIESNLIQATLKEVEAKNVELINTILPDGRVSDGRSLTLSNDELQKNNVQTAQLSDVIELNSSDIDYTKLINFLACRRWKAADYETMRIMLQAVNRNVHNFIREEEIQQFPCQILTTLDQLWKQYSNNRFGFSVQNHIWRNVGGNNIEDPEVLSSFAEQVGWQNSNTWLSYSEINFDLSAPIGYLPLTGIGCAVFGWWGLNLVGFYSRVNDCNLV